MRQLFVRVCRPVAALDTQGAFYRDWRLTAIDGTTFDLPDTKVNVEAFGRPPRSGRGEQDVGYPQLRMVGLVEGGTHAVFDAAIGALRTGEQALARAVLVSLRPGMLLLADRGFYGVDPVAHRVADRPRIPAVTIVGATKPKRVKRTSKP